MSTARYQQPTSDGHSCLYFMRRQRSFILGAFLTLAFLLAAASVSVAQVATGSTIRGVVKDPKGAVIPNATVTLTGVGRGTQRQVTTSSEGAYVFTAVDPGTYSIKVEAPGFKAFEQTGITLAPSETRGLDVTLEVGTRNETVTVTGDIPPIKTETGEKSETITSKEIDNLSIIGRSSLELLRILPGVVAPDPSDPNQSLDVVGFNQGANASANYYVNGIRGVNNQVSIDGSRVIDIGSNNGTIITPNNDMVQEVTVKSSNYAAEYGSSGVQISATTKAGTKDFHGELYDYIRPRGLAANDRSNSILGTPKPRSNFQYPGGNIGGPILLPFTNFNRNRDKLFFFVGFEVQRQSIDAGTRLSIVPTQAERAGDFSKSSSFFGKTSTGLPLICPPKTFNYSPCSSPAAPNDNLTSLANPLGVALLNLYPLPNYTPAPGSPQAAAGYNYASNVLSPQNRTDLKMRFDYNVSDNTKIYLRLAREAEEQDYPYGLWWGPSQIELPSHVRGNNLGKSAALNLTNVLNPTMTNEAVFSVSKLKLDNNYADPSKVTLSALGLQNLKTPFGNAPTGYAPIALIGPWDPSQLNGAQSLLWEPGNLPLFAHNDSISVTDTLAKIYKNHTLKFGGLIERADKTQNNSSASEGEIQVEAGNQARTTGNLFANIYTGQIDTFNQSTPVPTGHFRLWNFEGFGQDSWKVRPNFTLEYGLRISFFPNNYERDALGVVFDPSAYVRGAGAFIGGNANQPNGFLLASKGQIPKGVYRSNPPPQFAPRLNFAWDISGKGTTVIRGGAGLFYNRVQGNYQYGILGLPPNTLSVGLNSWGVANNDLTLSNLGTFNPYTQLAGSSVQFSQDLNNNKIPRIATMSLSVARRLPFQTVLEVSYVGTFGRHLPQTENFNYIYPGKLPAMVGNANTSDPLQREALGNNLASLPASISPLPYPDYGQVGFYEFIGTANYNSLQATLNRQLGKNLQFFVTYTFSKALGTTSINESSGSDQVDPVDIRHRSYGILPYDRTHIFNISYNYTLPNGARGSLDNRFLRGLLNGWQLSGITNVQSGRPMHLRFTGAITSTGTLLAYFGTNAYTQSSTVASGVAPILLSNPQTGNTNVGGKYLNLSAVQIPGFGTSGPYESPFYIRSPTTNNFDVTLFKNFNFTETKKLQFRMGFFNLFNEAFPNPDLGDINLTLNTMCNVTYNGNVNNGTGTTNNLCDPTKGFSFDQNTINNFGNIVSKHGHRRIELALKFYF